MLNPNNASRARGSRYAHTHGDARGGARRGEARTKERLHPRESRARDAEPDVGRSDEESDEGADELGITPKRFATSSRVTRRIGDGDASVTVDREAWRIHTVPSFSASAGVAFDKEVLGGLDDPEGRAWPEAAWNAPARVSAPDRESDVGGLAGTSCPSRLL